LEVEFHSDPSHQSVSKYRRYITWVHHAMSTSFPFRKWGWPRPRPA